MSNPYIRAVPVNQITNTFSSIGQLHANTPPSSLILKISVGYKSIKYFVQSAIQNQILFFGQYTLHHVHGNDELAKRLEKIYEQDEALQLNYYKVIIGLDSDYQLYPIGYFTDTGSSDLLLKQPLDKAGLEIVYAVNPQLNQRLQALFSNSRVVHLNSSLLQQAATQFSHPANVLLLNITPEYFDIISFGDDGHLRLMNRYAYKAQTDFIYFLLLCCEQLKIDREKINLVLSGEIDIKSQLYEMCYRYFRNISFIEAPTSLLFASEFDSYQKHLHYNLYSL